MSAKKSGKSQRLRLFEGDDDIAKEIAAKTKLDIADVISLACSAGLQAIKRNGYKMPLPLEMEVTSTEQQSKPKSEQNIPPATGDQGKKKHAA